MVQIKKEGIRGGKLKGSGKNQCQPKHAKGGEGEVPWVKSIGALKGKAHMESEKETPQ